MYLQNRVIAKKELRLLKKCQCCRQIIYDVIEQSLKQISTIILEFQCFLFTYTHINNSNCSHDELKTVKFVFSIFDVFTSLFKLFTFLINTINTDIYIYIIFIICFLFPYYYNTNRTTKKQTNFCYPYENENCQQYKVGK